MIKILSEPATGTFVRPSKLNVFIVDASGSMYYNMPRLADDTVNRISELPNGDALLIGLFSSQGWFQWIVSGTLDTAADRNKVEAAIRKEFHIRGMTCFSEIMQDTPKTIKPFLDRFPVVSLTFMSDGYPVVPDVVKEKKNLLAAASELKPYLTSGVVIAYGDYANKPLLTELASTLGVEITMAQSIESVGDAFLRTAGSKATKKKTVKVPGKPVMVFSVDESTVIPLEVVNGEVSATESSSVVSLDDFKVSGDLGLGYSAALALLSSGRLEEATEVVSNIGDVAIVDAIDSALTNAELARAETMIREAIKDKNARFTKGKSVGCKPAEDAFDVLDLLSVLQADREAMFYPYDPNFNYKRIGRSAKVKDGYPRFVPDAKGASLSRLVGNSTELNFSIGVDVNGHIELPDVLQLEQDVRLYREDVQLHKVYDCNIARNYSIISNANLNVTILPVSVSKNTFDVLAAHNLVSGGWKADKIYNIDLTRLPLCNKSKGKKIDWNELCKWGIEQLRIGAELKVYKAKLAELDPNRDSQKPIDLTEEQFVFLENCGVDRRGYFSPPTEKEDPTDVMDVREFEIKIKGSSPISYNKMLEDAKIGKLNWMGRMMFVAEQDVRDNMPNLAPLDWLNNKITALTIQKRAIDSRINSARFVSVLGGWWMKDHKDDSAIYNVKNANDTIQVTLNFRTKQVKI